MTSPEVIQTGPVSAFMWSWLGACKTHHTHEVWEVGAWCPIYTSEKGYDKIYNSDVPIAT
jgi:hypothetical protein